jgi:carboxyl-terminal processing protease
MKRHFAFGVLSMSALFAHHTWAQNTPAREPLPQEQLRSFAATYQMLMSDHVTALDGPELIRHAIRGMVRAADPEGGDFYDAEEFKVFREGSRPGEASVGLEVRSRNGQMVLAPLSGAPAAEAGVQLGDVLHVVDGKSIAPLRPQQVARLLRGPAGSKVSMTVFRESTLSAETFTIERRLLVSGRASASRPAPGVLMLAIPGFYGNTLEDIVKLLQQEWQGEPVRAVVLDLRGCPGGLLDTAVAISTIFLPENVTILRTTGRLPEANFVYRASKEFYQRRAGPDPLAGLPPALKTVPVAVLVDKGTASGAEIVAAALQDHRRAVIVGRPTYGRGTIQTVRPLNGTEGVRMTTALWVTPNGKPLHAIGITPDIEVDGADAVQGAMQKLLAP